MKMSPSKAYSQNLVIACIHLKHVLYIISNYIKLIITVWYRQYIKLPKIWNKTWFSLFKIFLRNSFHIACFSNVHANATNVPQELFIGIQKKTTISLKYSHPKSNLELSQQASRLTTPKLFESNKIPTL